MTTQRFELPLAGNKKIFAKLNGGWGRPLMILVHGLCDGMDGALHRLLAEHLERHGYSVLRFDLYGWHDGARKMNDCTLDTHATDLAAVIAYAQERYSGPIYIGGHSLGAYTVAMLAGHPAVNGIILIDPSHPTSPLVKTSKLQYVPEIESYLFQAGITVAMSEQYAKSVECFPLDDYFAAWDVPTLIVCAGGGMLREASEIYAQRLRSRSIAVKKRTVRNADHSFTVDVWTNKLHEIVLEWLGDTSALLEC